MKTLKIIIPFVAVLLCFATCKIDRQDKMIGLWKQIPFTDPDSCEIRYWLFYAGDILETYVMGFDSVGERTDTVSTNQYTYYTEGKTLVVSSITGDDSDFIVGSTDIRGTYWIDQLKKKKRYKMTRRKLPDGTTGGAYLRIEMVKQ
ncbi:MAG: hypothetical protein IKZ99_10795 [Salinivirgaceae bacterium]|nr:hypothetical protein [Salinivirgaceae bacterium]